MELRKITHIEQRGLLACGELQLVKLLDEQDIQLITSYKNRYVDFLKYYYYIGGMPEVVSRYVDTRDLNVVRKTQNRLLSAYENDFLKHAPTEIVTRIKMVWNSIPTQLAKENKKFIYGLLREGARAKEYEVAITWLIDSGLIYKINRIKKSDFPLRAYQDFAAFKLFVVDVGLLGAMCKLSAKVLLNKNALFEEFKGALTEQYVLQQLVTNSDNDIFYWSADNATAELDFLVQNEDRIIPIEVKAEENLQAKSLRTFYNKNNVGRGVRVSMSDHREQDWMVNIPLYNLNRMYDVE